MSKQDGTRETAALLIDILVALEPAPERKQARHIILRHAQRLDGAGRGANHDRGLHPIYIDERVEDTNLESTLGAAAAQHNGQSRSHRVPPVIVSAASLPRSRPPAVTGITQSRASG